MPVLRQDDSTPAHQRSAPLEGKTALVQRELSRARLHREQERAAMTPDERSWIEELLAEIPPPSCRAVSRTTGKSDWTIRRVKRELDGDARPMRQPRSQREEPSADETSQLVGWIVFVAIILGVGLLIWVAARSAPMSPEFPTSFYPESFTERKTDETEYPE